VIIHSFILYKTVMYAVKRKRFNADIIIIFMIIIGLPLYFYTWMSFILKIIVSSEVIPCSLVDVYAACVIGVDETLVHIQGYSG
jgi:hypothetical protein